MEKMLRLGKDYKGILGAAIGDISGSIINNHPSKKPTTIEEAKLFEDASQIGAATVMTAAIADGLRRSGEVEVSQLLKSWAKKYPHIDYGKKIGKYLFDEKAYECDSNNCSAAARISPVPYYVFSNDTALQYALTFASTSHAGTDGMLGAMFVSQFIYAAFHDAAKQELHSLACGFCDHESWDYEEMKSYKGKGKSDVYRTIPQALWAFFHSDSFEECLRLCHTIGQDTSNLCAIACSFAEAYYKEIPEWIVKEAQKRLPEDIKEALESVPTDGKPVDLSKLKLQASFVAPK